MTGPTNRRWLAKLLRRDPHQVIGHPDDPYLLRWYLIPRNPWINVYVHKFLRPDDDTPHDHPWWFVSLMLWGQYIEETADGRTIRSAPEPWRWFWGDRPLVSRPATWIHRVDLVKRLEWVGDGPEPTKPSQPRIRYWRNGHIPCWTLIVTGRRSRTWGFWCRHLVDFWTARTRGELDKVFASTAAGTRVEVARFVPWDEFHANGGCGEVD